MASDGGGSSSCYLILAIDVGPGGDEALHLGKVTIFCGLDEPSRLLHLAREHVCE